MLNHMTRIASAISAGTMIGGVIHCRAAPRFEPDMFASMRKKPGISRASSFQNGRLLLLLVGLRCALLAVTLVLLRGGVGVALRGGLRVFIGAALVWIVHMKAFRREKT